MLLLVVLLLLLLLLVLSVCLSPLLELRGSRGP